MLKRAVAPLVLFALSGVGFVAALLALDAGHDMNGAFLVTTTLFVLAALRRSIVLLERS